MDQKRYQDYRTAKTRTKISNQDDFHSLNLKIQQNLRNSLNLQKAIEHKTNEINFLQQMCQFLDKNTFKDSKNKDMLFKSNTQKGTMKSLTTPSMKLAHLQRQATNWEKGRSTQLKQSNFSLLTENEKKEKDNSSKCNISDHLKILLNPESEKNCGQNEQTIQELIIRRNNLYLKIQQKIKTDQPYIHDKIFAKIKRDCLKQTKLQAIAELQAIVKQKKNWLDQNKKKIDKQILVQNIQQAISGNLSKMKQLMNKKVQIDSYISGIAEDKKNIDKNISKIGVLTQKFRNYTHKQLQKFRQILIEQGIQEFDNVTQSKVDVFDEQQIQQLNKTMSQAIAALEKPLSSHKSAQILEQIEELYQSMVITSRK